LDKKYPLDSICQRNSDLENRGKRREEITTLDFQRGKIGNHFRDRILTGSLKLEGFTNLRTLMVSGHQLIELDLRDCPNLEELDCSSNPSIQVNFNEATKSNLNYNSHQGKLVKKSEINVTNQQFSSITINDSSILYSGDIITINDKLFLIEIVNSEQIRLRKTNERQYLSRNEK